MNAIWQAAEVREIRILDIGPKNGKTAGYFDDPALAAEAAAKWDARGNVYVTLNPVDPALLARAKNRIMEWPKHATADPDVLRRLWLFLDIDSVRPSGISATEDEVAAAKALLERVAVRLKVTLLTEQLRGLIHRIWAHDALRLERLQFPDDISAPRPKRRRKKTKEDLDLDEAIAAWPDEEHVLLGEVVAFREAVQLISRRYLGGEELLFPQSAHRVQGLLDILAVMRDVYRTMTSRRPPHSEAGFLRWVLEESTPESPVPPAVSPDPPAEERPDTRAAARSLVEHHVLMAKSEALEALGERHASIRLVEDWLRSRD